MKLYFQTYGQGSPLIILHGLFGMLDNWHTVARMLGSNLRVFAVDQRNHGRSPHSPDFNYDVMADDLCEFITAQDIVPSSLLGHSMGGKTAMLTALKYPHLVERLIVVDIAPRSYSSSHDTILEALQSIDLRTFSSRGEIDNALSDRIPETATRQFLLKNLSRDVEGTFQWKMNLPVIFSSYGNVMKGVERPLSFSKPTLFIRSLKSSYITDGDIPAIRRLFPNSTVMDFDTGHWVHAEQPGALVAAVKNFLQPQVP